ncbi:MAG: metallophosphoesterase [Desulfobulbaceae bacterium]|nr:metallophosphoesterase [Desulfobulbaceae bacterium]
MVPATPANDNRIFAIGDIHGCYDKLVTLLARLPYDPDRDTLVFIGDYIGRGRQARQVVEHLSQLSKDNPRVVTLMGNHELMLFEYHRHGDRNLLEVMRKNGVEDTMASYGRSNVANLRSLSFLPPSHRQFLENLLPIWQTDDYIFVHAGILPDRPLAEQDQDTFCWVRDMFLAKEHDFGKPVVFGHTPFATPLVTPTKIGIDTGAVYGNLLTAVELPGLRFYHA